MSALVSGEKKREPRAADAAPDALDLFRRGVDMTPVQRVGLAGVLGIVAVVAIACPRYEWRAVPGTVQLLRIDHWTGRVQRVLPDPFVPPPSDGT